MQGLLPQERPVFAAVRKQFGSANPVKLGVRAGSVFSMWSVFSSTGSANAWNTGAAVLLTYGSIAFSPAKLRSRLRSVGSVRAGWPVTYTVGAESLCTEKVEFPSFVRRLRLTSPIWFDGQAGAVVHEQFVCEYASVPSDCGIPMPPAYWSPSSTVTMNSVFDRSIPSFFRRWKYAANALSYACSCAT